MAVRFFFGAAATAAPAAELELDRLRALLLLCGGAKNEPSRERAERGVVPRGVVPRGVVLERGVLLGRFWRGERRGARGDLCEPLCRRKIDFCGARPGEKGRSAN